MSDKLLNACRKAKVAVYSLCRDRGNCHDRKTPFHESRRRTMKKMYSVFALLLVASMLLTACGGGAAGGAPDCKSADVFCVGVVTDVGKIDDKSFNQSAWEGVKQAEKDLGAKVQYIETTDAKDYDKNISTFGDANYDVIVTIGFALGEATTKAAGT